MSRVQPYGLCTTPPLPRPQRWPARGERGSDGSLPPYAGPLAGLWRGERDEAGRGPLKHTPNPYVSFLPHSVNFPFFFSLFSHLSSSFLFLSLLLRLPSFFQLKLLTQAVPLQLAVPVIPKLLSKPGAGSLYWSCSSDRPRSPGGLGRM